MRWPFKGLRIEWSQKTNVELIRKRGVSFEDVILAVEDDGNILDFFPHPNQGAYPRQTILVVNIQGYAYAAPFVPDSEKVFLKTIYKSRKLNKAYLSDNNTI